MGVFNSGSKKPKIKLQEASFEEVLTKGMGRKFIPSAEKTAIKEALAKHKGTSAAESYFSQEKPISRLKEAMRALEKEGVLKPYEGTRILNDYKRKWEIRKKNIQQSILEDMKKQRAKETLMSGEEMPEITERTLKRFLTPKELREIESKKRIQEITGRGSASQKAGSSSAKNKSSYHPPSVPLSR